MDAATTTPLIGHPTGRLQTIAGIPPGKFLRPTPSLTLIGVLSPLTGVDEDVVQLQENTTELGRDDSCSICLHDQLVSRRHARIVRDGQNFRIEDVGSVNGTFVDGVPVVSCQLHDGDTVQIGRTLFYFDRLYLRTDAPAPAGVPPEIG